MPRRTQLDPSSQVRVFQASPNEFNGMIRDYELTFRRDLPHWRQIWGAAWARIHGWLPPPGHCQGDWRVDVLQVAALATHIALSEYDPQRGIPKEDFVRMRVRHKVLAYARKEWRQGNHRKTSDLPERALADESPTALALADEVTHVLSQLTEWDRSILMEVFLIGKSTAEVGKALGKSRWWVRRRINLAFNQLRCGMTAEQ